MVTIVPSWNLPYAPNPRDTPHMPRPPSPRAAAWKAVSLLPPGARRAVTAPVRRRANAALRALPSFPDAATRLLIGPSNTAGQGWQWARATEAGNDGVAAQSLFVQRSAGQRSFRFPADVTITHAMLSGDPALHRDRVLTEATHVLAESGRSVLEDFYSRTAVDDAPALAAHGIKQALLFHGSDIRDLRRHRELYEHSPFTDLDDPYFVAVQRTVDRSTEVLAALDVPVFVSTPDLLDFVPGGRWLPVVVDVDRFATAAPALQGDRPVVLHAPSNPRLKGTHAIEPVLTELDARGWITYRRLEGVPNAEIPGAIHAADIVVDQVVLGNPGVLAAETMAAGRLVLAHLAPQVRERMNGAPIVDATPDSLRERLLEILDDRGRFAAQAAAGVEYARAHHNGTRSREVLLEFLTG